MGKVSKKTKKFAAKGHLGAAIRQRKAHGKIKRAKAARGERGWGRPPEAHGAAPGLWAAAHA